MPFLDAWNESAVTALGLFWTAFWAFALGYIISSMIQVFVTRERMQKLMGKDGLWSMVLATFFGFVSSSCSFAALAGARSLFTKGAGLAPSLAFLLASTNLVIELGILIAVFLSWPFVVGEYAGGILLIVFMWILVHITQPCINVESAREHARQQEQEDGGGHCGHHHHHQHHHHAPTNQQQDQQQQTDQQGTDNKKHHNHEHTQNDEENGGSTNKTDHHSEQSETDSNGSTTVNCFSWLQPFASLANWKQVAMTYCMEWGMVWKDVTIGFTVAGIIASFVPQEFFEWLFMGSGSDDKLHFGEILEQTIVGPIAAFFTFIGSMGNIPLAAVLYGNGVSFAGIMSFIFSDLVVFPILRINAKFYGWSMASYILAVFLLCLVATSLILHYIFDAIGILPSSDDVQAVSERDFFELNYTFGLNIGFAIVSIICFFYNFYQNGLPSLSTKGQGLIETVLFWLAWVAYLWLIGGLLAGLAN